MIKRTLAILFLILFLILISITGSSYILPRTQKAVNYSIEIVNMDKYNDYQFILVYLNIGSTGVSGPDRISTFKILDSSQLDNVWNMRTYRIYAIKKSDFNKKDITKNAILQEYSKDWDMPIYENLESYFENNPKLAVSGRSREYPWIISKTDPRNSITDILTIKSIEGNKLYIAGIEEEPPGVGTIKVYAPEDQIEPKKISLKWFLIITFGVFLIIIFYKKKRKK